MVPGVHVWSFTASAPASAAASTMASARSRLPRWLADISATMKGLFMGVGLLNVLEAERAEHACRALVLRVDVGEEFAGEFLHQLRDGVCCVAVAAVVAVDPDADLALVRQVDGADEPHAVVFDQRPELVRARQDEVEV